MLMRICSMTIWTPWRRRCMPDTHAKLLENVAKMWPRSGHGASQQTCEPHLTCGYSAVEMVRAEGFEPSRSLEHRHLKPACLPFHHARSVVIVPPSRSMNLSAAPLSG